MGLWPSTLRILVLGASGTGKTEFLSNLCHNSTPIHGQTNGLNSGDFHYRRRHLKLTEIGGSIPPQIWHRWVKRDPYECIYFFVNLEWTRTQLLSQRNRLFYACVHHPMIPICVIARWRREHEGELLSYKETVTLMQLEELGKCGRSVWFVQMTHYGTLALKGVELLLDWTIRTCQPNRDK